jgi:[protein-PII] uridylyltransferase
MNSPASPPAATGSGRVSAARQRVAASLATGVDGVAVCQRMSDDVEAIVRETAQPVLAEHPEIGLAAVGALARRELCPHSDLDLFLLAPDGSSAPLDVLVAAIVRPLWDAGLKTNLVVHTPEGWLREAAADVTLASAALDVRSVAGSPAIVDEFREAAARAYFGDARAAFIEKLREQTQERHARFGRTVFLLEPDLKHGPGGTRDLAAISWCLRATYGTTDAAELTARKVLPGPVFELLAEARSALLRLRAALQLSAHRAQDRLVFQYQESIPRVLGLLHDGPVSDAELVTAIELAMKSYYQGARDVFRYGRRVYELCAPAPLGPPPPAVRLDERFSIEGGLLRCRETDAFVRTPMLALSALALRIEHDVGLHGETFDAIAAAAADPGAASLADDPEAHRRFLALLTEPDDPRAPPTLELCHDLRLLERLVPEFRSVRGQMQHDPYHVYTVDEHTLRAIDMLKRIARGEHNKDYPLATALHQELDDARVLYLATLAHDLGKATDEDQCTAGAAIALRLAQRLGLSQDESARCARLVGEHLTMPMLSQKRDLGDPLLVASFADRIGDRTALKELYLLSLVDTAQVRPGNLTSWKLALLDELYLRASAYLRGRQPRWRHIEREGEPAGMPERYYTIFHAAMRRSHGELVERLLAERRNALIAMSPSSGALRLTFVAVDRPGLLAHVTRVLDDAGLEIMAADIFSRPGNPPIAIDVFRIEPIVGDTTVDAELITRIEDELEHGTTDVTQPPPRRAPPRRRRVSTAATEVTFSADLAGERTIVDVDTAEGPSVLRRMTQAFAAEHIEILLARCAIEGTKISNVFYVPKLGAHQAAALEARLQDYLAVR